MTKEPVRAAAFSHKMPFTQPPCSPIPFEDIPREVLQNYGFIIEEEKETVKWDGGNEDEEDEESRLVIDDTAEVFYPESVLGLQPSRTHVCGFKHCRKSFTFGIQKLEHEAKHCKVCHAVFADVSTMEEHAAKHCTLRGCLDLVEDMEALLRHKSMHQNQVKPFQCANCKRRFKYYSFYKKHGAYCKVLSGQHACSQCNSSFRKASMLYKHMQKHTRSTITCTLCSQGFIKWKAYSDHVQKIHSKRLVYKCTNCPKAFLGQVTLTHHLRKHSIDLDVADIQNYATLQDTKEPGKTQNYC